MSSDNWVVVSGISVDEKSDFPWVNILCGNREEVAEVVQKYNILEPSIESYELFLKSH